MTVNPAFQRLILLTGPEAAQALEKSRVIVVGIGGVGSWCAEALVRSGIGKISIVDSDNVCVSNINRQIQALETTVGRLKTEVLEERLKEINPLCEVSSFPRLFSKETAGVFDISGADYVIDAIDTLEYKLDLIEIAVSAGKKLYSSMGMAKKLDPALIKTADIWETRGCPLARLVRQGLRKRGFSGNFTAVYSAEIENKSQSTQRSAMLRIASSFTEENGKNTGKMPIGSAVPVTATAGMILASLVIRDVCARFEAAPGVHCEQ